MSSTVWVSKPRSLNSSSAMCSISDRVVTGRRPALRAGAASWIGCADISNSSAGASTGGHKPPDRPTAGQWTPGALPRPRLSGAAIRGGPCRASPPPCARHGGGPHPHRVATGMLRAVHRGIGHFEQPPQLVAVDRHHCAPDGDAEVVDHRLPYRVGEVDPQRPDPPADALRHRLRPGVPVLTVEPGQENDELLAPEAPDDVVVAHLAAHRRRDGGEHLVA